MLEMAKYVWRAAVSSKGSFPVFVAVSVCVNVLSPTSTCSSSNAHARHVHTTC